MYFVQICEKNPDLEEILKYTPLIINFLVCFSEVDRLLSCIGKSLEDQQCGPEAITLKDKLARTLIRGSQGCDKVSLP